MSISFLCNSENNRVSLVGVLARPFVDSHLNHGNEFSTAVLKVRRRSGIEDSITLVAMKKDLEGIDLKIGTTLEVEGLLKTYYKPDRFKSLNIYVSVTAINTLPDDVPHQNQVWIRAQISIYNKLALRKSPLGRQILDFMVQQGDRNSHKRTYNFQCIAFGSLARRLARVELGSTIVFNGRLQSRIYDKVTPENEVVKILTHEIAVNEVLDLYY